MKILCIGGPANLQYLEVDPDNPPSIQTVYRAEEQPWRYLLNHMVTTRRTGVLGINQMIRHLVYISSNLSHADARHILERNARDMVEARRDYAPVQRALRSNEPVRLVPGFGLHPPL